MNLILRNTNNTTSLSPDLQRYRMLKRMNHVASSEKMDQLKASYYYKGLRKHISDLQLQGGFGFLNDSLELLDTIMSKYVFSNDNIFSEEYYGDPSVVKGNCIWIDNKAYVFSPDIWQNMFYDIIGNESKGIVSNKESRIKLFDQMVAAFHQMLLPTFKTGNLFSDKVNVDTIIDPLHSSLIQRLVIARSNQFTKKTDDLDYELLVTDDSARYFGSMVMQTLQDSYAHYGQRFNNKQLTDVPDNLQQHIKLPYTGTAKYFGEMSLNIVFDLDSDNFIGHNKEFLLMWLGDPNIGNPKKLLSVQFHIGFIKFKLTSKEQKFFITSACLAALVKFKGNSQLQKKYPQIFYLLSAKIEPSTSDLTEYVERFKIRLGVTIINLLTRQGVIETILLVSANETKSEKVQARPVYEKLRVIIFTEDVGKALLKNTALVRPYLIHDNITEPFDQGTFHVDDNIKFIYAAYKSSEGKKIHENENSKCTVHRRSILYHTGKFTIDQNALLDLLDLYHNWRSEWFEHTEDFSYIPTSYIYEAYLSLYDIDPVHMNYLLQDPSSSAMARVLIYYVSSLDYEEYNQETIYGIINGSIMSPDLKRHFKQLFDKVTGIRYSLKGLISESIVYSHFNRFIISTYIDTRGRRYYRNTLLNVQAYGITKTIVKLANRSLETEIKPDEYYQLCKAVWNYVNNFPIDNQLRNVWLKKYGFDDDSKWTTDDYKIRCRKARQVQLAKYLVSVNIEAKSFPDLELATQILEIALKTFTFNQHDNNIATCTLREIILVHLKSPKDFFKVFNLAKTIARQALRKKHERELLKAGLILRYKPYPYELDATASGIQMTGFFLRCPQLLQWSGVIYNPKRDLYTTAANIFTIGMKKVVDLSSKIMLHPILTPVEPLSTYIPEEFQWFLKTINKEDTACKKKKPSIKESIGLFTKKAHEINHIFKDNTKLYQLCQARDIWKKSIMTYGYNSTRNGRIESNIKYFEDNGIVIHPKTLRQIATLVEDFFIKVVQPTLIPSTSKMKELSALLASNLNPNKLLKDGTSPIQSLKIKNNFLTHEICPPIVKTVRMTTNPYKGKSRGHQVNLQLDTYNKQGAPLYDHDKAKLLFGPNLIHMKDAAVVHLYSTMEKGVNRHSIKNGSTYPHISAIIHDCILSSEPRFMKAFINFIYLIVSQTDNLKTLEANSDFEEVKRIIGNGSLDLKEIGPHAFK